MLVILHDAKCLSMESFICHRDAAQLGIIGEMRKFRNIYFLSYSMFYADNFRTFSSHHYGKHIMRKHKYVSLYVNVPYIYTTIYAMVV